MDTRSDELPLSGIRVVDFSQMVAGPAAALWLADYGATVVKVEPPRGDGGRSLVTAQAAHLDPPPMFGAYNRNKTAARIDLKTAAGVALAWELIGTADVVLESSAPGVMAALGLGADDVLARFPRVIHASVSGFGTGPRGGARRGVDLIVQAESGVMAVTGHPDGPPTKVGFTVIDAACGHALCHGILAALFRRERTGSGGTVHASLYDVALNLQAGTIAEYLWTGHQPARFGNSAAHTSPADLFTCSDGQIVLAAYLDAHFAKLVDLLADEGLRTDQRYADAAARVVNRASLYDRIAEHLRGRPVRHWIDTFSAAGLLVAQLKDYAAVLADPVTAESGVLIDEPSVKGVGNPVRLAASPAPVPMVETTPERLLALLDDRDAMAGTGG